VSAPAALVEKVIRKKSAVCKNDLRTIFSQDLLKG
jgi:hypothetical protein